MDIVSDDKELVLKLSKGDRKVFEYIYITYHEKLFVYLLSFTKSDFLAEDIAQNVFLKLWERRANLKIHTSLKSYLYKAAYNAFIDNYKSKMKINKKLEDIKYESLNKIMDLNEDKYIMEQRLSLLSKAIDSLPPQCQKVLMLSKIEGYKNKEIAEVLNLSVKTVENHMSNAFKLLRKMMFVKNRFFLFFNLWSKKLKRKVCS